jgi:hypothetical protein
MEHPMNFGGVPGEQVPQVDPEDIKAAWSLVKEIEKNRPPGLSGTIGIDCSLFKRVCKPGANVEAVAYRNMIVGGLCRLNPEVLESWTTDGEVNEAVFRAIAQVRVKWVGIGPNERAFPFDVDEFQRLLREC